MVQVQKTPNYVAAKISILQYRPTLITKSDRTKDKAEQFTQSDISIWLNTDHFTSFIKKKSVQILPSMFYLYNAEYWGQYAGKQSPVYGMRIDKKQGQGSTKNASFIGCAKVALGVE